MQSEEQRAFQAGYDARANCLPNDQAQASRDQWLWIADQWDAGWQKADQQGQSFCDTVSDIIRDTFPDFEE